MRGVIDRFEGVFAVVVLDDAQQLLWPRAVLPALAQPGTAVRLHLVFSPPEVPDASGEICLPESISSNRTAAELPVRAQHDVASDQWQLVLADGGVLRWPAESTLCEAEQPARLRLVVDFEDTAARRKRVQSLLDQLFGQSEA